MKKLILIATIAMLFLVGCKDTVKVSCPDCNIKVIDGVKQVDCKQCTIEAEVSEDFKLIERRQ